jgi:hypothetical protein
MWKVRKKTIVNTVNPLLEETQLEGADENGREEERN